MFWSILLGIAVTLLWIACLTWKILENWTTENVINDSSCIAIIKERLANGDYKVVAGVFDQREELQTASGWKTEELENELEEEFRNNNDLIVIDV